jgi:hypothetical protein
MRTERDKIAILSRPLSLFSSLPESRSGCERANTLPIDDIVVYRLFASQPIPLSSHLRQASHYHLIRNIIHKITIIYHESSIVVNRSRHWTAPSTLPYFSMLQVANPPSEHIHQAHFQPRQQNSHPPFTLSVTRPSSASNDSPGHHKYGSAHIPALAALASLAASAPAAPVKRESVR